MIYHIIRRTMILFEGWLFNRCSEPTQYQLESPPTNSPEHPPPALSTFSVPLCKARPYPHRVNPGMQPEEKAWQNLVHNLKARWLCPNIQSVIHQEVGNHNKLDLYVTIWPYAGLKTLISTRPVFWTYKKRDHPLEHNETDICNI